MPGRKDFVSANKEGKREYVQKRLILSNLKELYSAFKDAYPGKKVGLSKFAEMRPHHCVLAGAGGTHTVGVCTIYQNMKLMVSSAKLSKVAAPERLSLSNCLAAILCNPPLPICY